MASIPINNLTNQTDINGAELLPFVRDGKTYRCSVTDLFYNGVITTLKIANSAITTDKINNDAITTIKLANSAITTEKINNSAITTIKLASSAVTTDKIDNSAITTFKIANSAVTTDKIADSNVTPAKLSQPLTLVPAQSSTSGTSINFTGIPSWVKRITVMFEEVSNSSASGEFIIRLGTASGFELSGYKSAYVVLVNVGVVLTGASTSGFTFPRFVAGAADKLNGMLIINKLSSNTWTAMGSMAHSNSPYDTSQVSGSKTLAGELTSVQVSVNAGAFDGGSISIMYE